MTRQGRCPQELRERAVRMVFGHQDEHPSQWAAITSIAHRFGVSAETLRKWVRRAEVDDGLRPGPTSVTPKLASRSPAAPAPRWWPKRPGLGPAPALFVRHPHRHSDRCLVHMRPAQRSISRSTAPSSRSTPTVSPGGA